MMEAKYISSAASLLTLFLILLVYLKSGACNVVEK